MFLFLPKLLIRHLEDFLLRGKCNKLVCFPSLLRGGGCLGQAPASLCPCVPVSLRPGASEGRGAGGNARCASTCCRAAPGPPACTGHTSVPPALSRLSPVPPSAVCVCCLRALPGAPHPQSDSGKHRDAGAAPVAALDAHRGARAAPGAVDLRENSKAVCSAGGRWHRAGLVQPRPPLGLHVSTGGLQKWHQGPRLRPPHERFSSRDSPLVVLNLFSLLLF